jgi:hypothetical protein
MASANRPFTQIVSGSPIFGEARYSTQPKGLSLSVGNKQFAGDAEQQMHLKLAR